MVPKKILFRLKMSQYAPHPPIHPLAIPPQAYVSGGGGGGGGGINQALITNGLKETVAAA